MNYRTSSNLTLFGAQLLQNLQVTRTGVIFGQIRISALLYNLSMSYVSFRGKGPYLTLSVPLRLQCLPQYFKPASTCIQYRQTISYKFEFWHCCVKQSIFELVWGIALSFLIATVFKLAGKQDRHLQQDIITATLFNLSYNYTPLRAEKPIFNLVQSIAPSILIVFFSNLQARISAIFYKFTYYLTGTCP